MGGAWEGEGGKVGWAMGAGRGVGGGGGAGVGWWVEDGKEWDELLKIPAKNRSANPKANHPKRINPNQKSPSAKSQTRVSKRQIPNKRSQTKDANQYFETASFASDRRYVEVLGIPFLENTKCSEHLCFFE